MTNIQVTNRPFQSAICQVSYFIYLKPRAKSIKWVSHTKNDYCKSNNYKINKGKYFYLMILGIQLYITNVSSFLACPSSSLQCMFIAYSCFTLTVNNLMDLPICFRRINHVESVQQNLSRPLMLCPAIKMSHLRGRELKQHISFFLVL